MTKWLEDLRELLAWEVSSLGVTNNISGVFSLRGVREHAGFLEPERDYYTAGSRVNDAINAHVRAWLDNAYEFDKLLEEGIPYEYAVELMQSR